MFSLKYFATIILHSIPKSFITDVSIYCNDSIDAHVLENYSEEDSCLAFESIDIDELNRRPIELPLECSLPDYIDKTKVSKLLVENLITGLKNDVDIGFILEVPAMIPFEETPAGIHLRSELALKELELCALQEKMNNWLLNNDTFIHVDLSILDKPSITYTAIDLDDIFSNFLQDLHSNPLVNTLQCLIDDNSLDIEFANLNTDV